MSKTSHSTEALLSLAGELERCTIGEQTADRLESVGLPDKFWPALTHGAASDTYGRFYETVHEAADTLQKVTVALGENVHAIAHHYRATEEEQADDLGELGDED